MPGIKKCKEIRVLDDDEEEVSRYCFHCKEYGFYNRLGPKILIRGQRPAPDHDKWCQCYSCGIVYARHETTPEEKITGVVETINNPFDDEKQITGLGNKLKKTKNEKILEQIDEQEDPEIRTELRKGNIVETT
jgi:hypothetical protein